jgi:PAS domain-containing protein
MLGNVSKLEIGPVFDALDVGIVVVDDRCCIVAWNDWIARVIRRSKASVLGKALYDVFPNLHDTRVPTAIEDSLLVGSSSILTHSLNKLLPLFGDDGQELLYNIIVLSVSSGESNLCPLQINDVTVPVTRERILRERQNARYHAIVDSAPDAIITTSLDRTIQWLNGTAEHVFGYATQELLGQKLDILLEQSSDLSRAFADDRKGVIETERPSGSRPSQTR